MAKRECKNRHTKDGILAWGGQPLSDDVVPDYRVGDRGPAYDCDDHDIAEHLAYCVRVTQHVEFLAALNNVSAYTFKGILSHAESESDLPPQKRE
jgi:hypothetical protein